MCAAAAAACWFAVCKAGTFLTVSGCSPCKLNFYCPINSKPLPCPGILLTEKLGAASLSACGEQELQNSDAAEADLRGTSVWLAHLAAASVVLMSGHSYGQLAAITFSSGSSATSIEVGV